MGVRDLKAYFQGVQFRGCAFDARVRSGLLTCPGCWTLTPCNLEPNTVLETPHPDPKPRRPGCPDSELPDGVCI